MTKSTLEEVKRAVAALDPKELARFRRWFATFDAMRFDERIASDAASGALDDRAEEALSDLGRSRPTDLNPRSPG